MTGRRSLICALLLIVLLLGGCGFFSRKPNTFYSLDTTKSAATPAAIGGVPIGVDGVELPPGIDRREIVVRGADQKLELRGTQQWGAPLEDMVIHTLAFDLANRLPEGMVILPGAAKPSVMRNVYVVFEDLAAGTDNVFVLDARVIITEPGRPELARHERITVNMASNASGEIATAMTQALGQLTDRIVAQLSAG